MARPKKDEDQETRQVFSVSLPHDIGEWLRAVAKRRSLPLSYVVQDILSKEMEK